MTFASALMLRLDHFMQEHVYAPAKKVGPAIGRLDLFKAFAFSQQLVDNADLCSAPIDYCIVDDPFLIGFLFDHKDFDAAYQQKGIEHGRHDNRVDDHVFVSESVPELLQKNDDKGGESAF